MGMQYGLVGVVLGLSNGYLGTLEKTLGSFGRESGPQNGTNSCGDILGTSRLEGYLPFRVGTSFRTMPDYVRGTEHHLKSWMQPVPLLVGLHAGSWN